MCYIVHESLAYGPGRRVSYDDMFLQCDVRVPQVAWHERGMLHKQHRVAES